MDKYDISEYSYKNGYEAGVKDLANRIKQEINFPMAVWKVFDNIVKEMVGDE